MSADESVMSATRTRLDDVEDESGQAGRLPAGGDDPADVDLGFDVERQEQNQWCWAAVAVSVAKHYDPDTRWRQCSLVDAELGRTICCDDGSSIRCNVSWYLDRALGRIGHLRAMKPSAADLLDVLADLAAGQPLGVRIGWTGGEGHFVALVGIRHDGHRRIVRIGDPLHGNVEEVWPRTVTRYLGYGRWTHTYFTQP